MEGVGEFVDRNEIQNESAVSARGVRSSEGNEAGGGETYHWLPSGESGEATEGDAGDEEEARETSSQQ